MFKKILIANRGEIACRVIKTARRLGVLTVAVYSDADKNALHVRMADEAVYIGASPASESYLIGEAILAAAMRTGAEAIHPGYGFLSENADFCALCADKGIVFIGPPAKAIAAMGSKAAAKRLMEKAKVPLIPGYHGEDQSPERLKTIADEMGYPVLLKAAAGGGGRGMRPVHEASQFHTALSEAKRESLSSFGDDEIIIEKYLARSRHVEVQIFCDQQGSGVYVSDRDCSVQRRHQKVVEEAPAPGLSDKLRQAMGEAAVRAAQAIDYVGAGTIEFLLDSQIGDEDNFYFMEMNTRLQVEHPVTELVTGLDLVEWQLKIASGEPLPLQQDAIKIRGHAFEARVYAEDPQENFRPSTGRLIYLQAPAASPNIRVDTGVAQGDSVSPYYDAMIAKLLSWGDSRESARKHIVKGLGDYQIAGVKTNLSLLTSILSHKAFAAADIDTHFIESHKADLLTDAGGPEHSNIVLAALYLLLKRKRGSQVCDLPWASGDSWRVNQARVHRVSFTVGDRSYPIVAEEMLHGEAAYFSMQADDRTYRVSGRINGESLSADIDGYRVAVVVVDHQDDPHLSTLITRHESMQFRLDTPDMGEEDEGQAQDSCTAPMNGRILELTVKPGDQVALGDRLVVMEAMKMEHTIVAPKDGTVAGVFCAQGDLVDGGRELVTFVDDEESASE